MGSKPFLVKHINSTSTHPQKPLNEPVLFTSEHPNCELLLAYYANEVSMNKKIKSLFEIIFAHDENETSEINLSFLNIDVKSAYHLKIILHYFTNIEVLKLSRCCLNFKNLKRLSRTLPSFVKLSSLHLDGNSLSLDGVNLVAKFFRYWPRLEILNLSQNDLQVEEFEVLFQHIPELVELKELYLSYNKAGDESVEHIEKVASVERLEVIEIAGNGLSAEGIRRIINRFPRSLKKADFRDNEVSSKSCFILVSKYPNLNLRFE